MCSYPDCCRGFLSVSIAALLLVKSAMLQNLSLGSKPKAYAIAASSPEYEFCFDFMPSVEEKASSFGVLCLGICIWTAPPIPTTSFRAELLIAICTDQSASVCLPAVSLTLPYQNYMLLGYGCVTVIIPFL
jgi:hypothetical protein